MFRIFIFLIILFLYIHLNFHLNTSNDLNVYHINKPSKKELEEVCDIKQPLNFKFGNQHICDVQDTDVSNNIIEKPLSTNISYDTYFAPYLVCNKTYSTICGDKNTSDVFKSGFDYRHYLLVMKGEIEINLALPKEIIHLNNNNTTNIVSTVDLADVKTIKIRLMKGDVLYIPPYWWYKITFIEKSTITSLKYHSLISYLSIAPKICLNLIYRYNNELN